MESVHELLQIERSVVLRAPRSRVWRALTDKDEFATWFQLKLTGDFAPGTRTTAVTSHPEYAHLVFPIYVQRKEPESLFSWRWVPGTAFDGKDESQMTEVTFTLEEVPEGTRLTVTETGFEQISLEKRAKAHEVNDQGWAIQLDHIDQHLRNAR